MNEWCYASGGKRNGLVSFEQLVEIARSGGLDPAKGLVWTSTMKDWLPAGKVPGIFGTAVPASDPSHPYAAPESIWTGDSSLPTPTGETLPEIVPGSETIDVGGCVKRGFDMTTRNFGMILLVGIVYVTFAVSATWKCHQTGSPLNGIVSQILSVFLSLDASRIGLLELLIVIAGCLALCVGMFFAIPVMWLGWAVAYRWMQYAHRAALDHPGTTRSMLSGL